RVAKAPGEDPLVRPGGAPGSSRGVASGDRADRNERVVARHGAVEVHAQELAVALVETAAELVDGRRRVRAGVADAKVELSLVDEKASSVVVRGSFEPGTRAARSGDDGRRVDGQRVAGVEHRAVDAVLVGRRAVRNVEVEGMVRYDVRIGYDAEQPLLGARI